MRVGLIGFGSVGRAVADRLARGQGGDACLCAVLVRSLARVPGEARERFGEVFHEDLAGFLAARPDWAVEAAGHEGLRQWGPAVLDGGVNLMAISAGALADDAFHDELRRRAVAAGRRVVVPSGGMGALDLLGSAALERLDNVQLTTRKPPRALPLTPEEQAEVVASGKPRLVFEGTARQAAPIFPENLNICCALGLAGAGLDRTRVRVWADPRVTRNTHRISARGWFGAYALTMRHIPSENPKTGRVVALSIVKALRDLGAPFVVGG